MDWGSLVSHRLVSESDVCTIRLFIREIRAIRGANFRFVRSNSRRGLELHPMQRGLQAQIHGLGDWSHLLTEYRCLPVRNPLIVPTRPARNSVGFKSRKRNFLGDRIRHTSRLVRFDTTSRSGTKYFGKNKHNRTSG